MTPSKKKRKGDHIKECKMKVQMKTIKGSQQEVDISLWLMEIKENYDNNTKKHRQYS